MADVGVHTRPEITTPTAGVKLLGDDGAATILVDVDNLPISAPQAEQISGKAEQATMDTALNSLSAQIAAKEDVLSFIGASRAGATVTIDPAIVGGNLLDGKTWYVLPAATAFSTPGVTGVANTVGAYSIRNPNASGTMNAYSTRGRAQLQGAATTGNHARVYSAPAHRWASDNSPYYGFKISGVYAAADALTTGMGAFGIVQNGNIPAIGVAPSAYTGSRFLFLHNPGDTTLSLYWGSTLIKALGASFPCQGDETNVYDWTIESVPNASGPRTINWSIRHRITGAEDSGTLTGTGPVGDHQINVLMVRDSNGSATQATLTTTGYTGGAFTSLAIGERLDVPAPVRITGNTNLTKALHANIGLFVKSATPVTLTIAASGFTDGDVIMGRNSGAGAVTFVGDGFTIEKHPDLPATVEQWQGFTLTYDATDNVWAREA